MKNKTYAFTGETSGTLCETTGRLTTNFDDPNVGEPEIIDVTSAYNNTPIHDGTCDVQQSLVIFPDGQAFRAQGDPNSLRDIFSSHGRGSVGAIAIDDSEQIVVMKLLELPHRLAS